jgi:LysM repeat protein
MKKSAILSVVFSVMFFCVSLVYAGDSNVSDYVVKKGDVIWKIAQKNELDTKTLCLANPDIKNPNKIFPGQIIKIPIKKVVQVTPRSPSMNSVIEANNIPAKNKTESSALLQTNSSKISSGSISDSVMIYLSVFAAKAMALSDLAMLSIMLSLILLVLTVSCLMLKKYSEEDEKYQLRKNLAYSISNSPEEVMQHYEFVTNDNRIFIGAMGHINKLVYCMVDDKNKVSIFDPRKLPEIIAMEHGDDFSSRVTFDVSRSKAMKGVDKTIRPLSGCEQGILVSKIFNHLRNRNNESETEMHFLNA